MRPSILHGIAVFIVLSRGAFASDTFNPTPVFQEPGDDASFQRLTVDSGGKTPTVKKIDPAWAKSLADHGEATVYTKANSQNFQYLGMPIGGIGTGELYLGGDGKLWEWDIFGTRCSGGFPVELGLAYPKPHTANKLGDSFQTVIQQGFVLETKAGDKTDVRTIDKEGFTEVKFKGQYPVGYVDYADSACPVSVQLEAFSPFNPGNVADSEYPATILNYTLTNTSGAEVTCTLGGWLENAVAVNSRRTGFAQLKSEAAREDGFTLVSYSAAALKQQAEASYDIIDDFESGNYGKWTAEGDAFRHGPQRPGDVGRSNPVIGVQGHYYVDTYSGNDKATGKLTSKPFTISRPYVRFLIAGGKNPGVECVNLIVDGQQVESATGAHNEIMQTVAWDVTKYKGKQAQIQIVDAGSAAWDHILVDDISQGDNKEVPIELKTQTDVGTMALAALGGGKTDVIAQIAGPDYAHGLLDAPVAGTATATPKKEGDKLVGGLRRHFTLEPGEKKTVSFVVAWYFPNPLTLGLRTDMKRHYTTRFTSAADVVSHVASGFKHLADITRQWHDTWYDSTLPWWFLDRTFANVSTLATSTSYYLADGRWYGYEGRYSCPGNCSHVWGYQPAMGFLFPELDQALLEKSKFVPGLGMRPDGGVAMRDEFDSNPPVDGQAGTILRTYLVDRMNPDQAFLKRNYASVKKATDYFFTKLDKDQTGILTGPQANTMDSAWWGKNTWLSLHYQAGLRAMAEMADRMNDAAYATKLRGIADKGRDYIEQHLWNGEYFFHEGDPTHPDSQGTYAGCPIEQLMGQAWAGDVGLGTIIDPAKANTAINSMWKYNYTTDAGFYRDKFKDGRWYAMAGESGLIMCTWPDGNADALQKGAKGFAAYDNESWTGSEHEIVTAMMWEGQVDKALAEERAINDRYAGDKRNPWDECECGSHYSRAMSSYGVYIAACGFEYDGPRQSMAFAPRVHPEDFRAAFTAARGWGSFSQKVDGNALTTKLDLKHGELELKEFALALPAGVSGSTVKATIAGKPVQAATSVASKPADGGATRVTISFPQGMHLNAGQALEVALQ